MTELKFLIFLLWTTEAFINLPKSYEARFESWKSTGSIIEFRVRLLGRDHRVNGTIILREDLGNDFTLEGETYNDPTGSGDFKQSPFTALRTPLCKFLDSYWKYFKTSVEYGTNTNCPFINQTCPKPKGEYYLKDVIIKPDDWPLIMPRGFFKGIGIFRKDKQVVGTQEVVISIVDRTT